MMKENESKISEFIVHWIDDFHCLLGFTITYQDGTIENKLKKCTTETYQQVMKELKDIREKYKSKIS